MTTCRGSETIFELKTENKFYDFAIVNKTQQQSD